jgi:hypothetical protein
MKLNHLKLIILGLCAALLAAVCCGSKEDTTEPEPWTSFIGSWTAELKYDQDGDQIKESTNIIFYTSFRYRWTFNYYVNNLKDESNSYVDEGDYEVTDTAVTFTSDKGEVKNCTYELTGRSDVLLIINDDKGNVWEFTEHEKSRWQTY